MAHTFAKVIKTHVHALEPRRLWIWVNGSPVKVRLEVGEELLTSESSATEEGYHLNQTTYRINIHRQTIEMSSFTKAKDCDGVHQSIAKYECGWGNLEANLPREEDKHWIPPMPLWERK